MDNSSSYPHRLDNYFAVAHTLHNTATDFQKIRIEATANKSVYDTDTIDTFFDKQVS